MRNNRIRFGAKVALAELFLWAFAAHGQPAYFNVASGKFEDIPLGPRSAPHGVIVGPDGAAWGAESGNDRLVMVPAK